MELLEGIRKLAGLNRLERFAASKNLPREMVEFADRTEFSFPAMRRFLNTFGHNLKPLAKTMRRVQRYPGGLQALGAKSKHYRDMAESATRHPSEFKFVYEWANRMKG